MGIEIPNLTDSQKLYAKMLEKLFSLDAKVDDFKERQDRHQKILIDGNGQLPLIEQVRNNTKYIEEMKYWSKFLIGALIIQTLAFLGGVIVAVVQFLPVLQKLASP